MKKMSFLPWWTYPNTYKINWMILKFKSLAWSTSHNCTHISNAYLTSPPGCLTEISNSKCQQSSSSSFPTLSSPSCLPLYFLVNPPLQWPSPKGSESTSTSFSLSLFFFFLYIPKFSSSARPVGFALERIQKLTLSCPTSYNTATSGPNCSHLSPSPYSLF